MPLGISTQKLSVHRDPNSVNHQSWNLGSDFNFQIDTVIHYSSTIGGEIIYLMFMWTIKAMLPIEGIIHTERTVRNLLLTLAEDINNSNAVLHAIHISFDNWHGQW